MGLGQPLTCPSFDFPWRKSDGAVGVVDACRRGGYAQAACPPRASQRQTGWCDYRGLARPTVLRQWRGAATGSGTGKTLLARHCQPRGCRCGHASLPRCPGRSPKGTSQTRCGRAPRPFATILARPQRVPPTSPRRPRGSVHFTRALSRFRQRAMARACLSGGWRLVRFSPARSAHRPRSAPAATASRSAFRCPGLHQNYPPCQRHGKSDR